MMGKGEKRGLGSLNREGGGWDTQIEFGEVSGLGGTMEKEVKREGKGEAGKEEGQFHGCPPLSLRT